MVLILIFREQGYRKSDGLSINIESKYRTEVYQFHIKMSGETSNLTTTLITVLRDTMNLSTALSLTRATARQNCETLNA